jgi:6-phosphogluconolactonase (cycloisomerase 2 family)
MPRGPLRTKIPASGTLSPMSPTPSLANGASTTPRSGLVTADGAHFYVANNGNGTIGQYSRNADGSLTALAPATVACNYGPFRLVESPDAKHIYCTSAGGDVVRCFSRNSGTGQLSLVGSYATGYNPCGVAISSDGAYVYVANKAVGGTPSVSQFSRNSTTGALTALSPATITFGVTDSEPIEIQMYGTSVYVGCFIGSLFYAFDQNSSTGLLSAAATPSYTAGNKPAWIAISPDGTSLYAPTSITQVTLTIEY